MNAARREPARFGRSTSRPAKRSGKPEGDALELCFATPTLVQLKDKSFELVVAVPSEVWGLKRGTPAS